MCDAKAQEDEGPEEGEIQDDDEDEASLSLSASSPSSSYERDIRNHERQRAARKYFTPDTTGSLNVSIINDKMLSRTNHERRDKSRVRPKHSEGSHHKTSGQPRSGLTHGKENRHVHQSKVDRSALVQHSERPKSKTPDRSSHSRDHTKTTGKRHRSVSSRSSEGADREPGPPLKKKRNRRSRRGGVRQRKNLWSMLSEYANAAKDAINGGNTDLNDDTSHNVMNGVEANEENSLKRKLLTMGALGTQSQPEGTLPCGPIPDVEHVEIPNNAVEIEIAHPVSGTRVSPEKSSEAVSKSGEVDSGVIFIAAVPKPVPELVTLSDSDAEQDMILEVENVDCVKGQTDIKMSRSSASSNIDMDLESTIVEVPSKTTSAVAQLDQDDDDIVSLRRAALMSKNKPKDPSTNAELEEDDLQLRVAALRSAVMRKAEVRKKRRLQAVGQLPGDETTPVDMDLADTDDDEEESQPRSSPEPPALPMPPMPSESLLKTISLPAAEFHFPDLALPPPSHFMPSFLEPVPTQRDNIPRTQMDRELTPREVPADPLLQRFPDCPTLRHPSEVVVQMDCEGVPLVGPHTAHFPEPGFPGRSSEFSAPVQSMEYPVHDFSSHPTPTEFPVHPVPPPVPLEYPDLPLEYPPPAVPPVEDYPVNNLQYQLEPSVDYDPAVPTSYPDSLTFAETAEPAQNFIAEEWNREENQPRGQLEPLSQILTKAMRKKIQNTRPNLLEIKVNQPPSENDKPESEIEHFELFSMVVLDEVAESPVSSPVSSPADNKNEAPTGLVKRQASVDEDEVFLREKLLKAISSKRDQSQPQEKVATGSSKPVDKFSRPSDITSKPPDKSTKPSDETSVPPGMSTKPSDETSVPPGMSTKPSDKNSKPPGISTKPSDKTSKPPDKSTKPSDKTSKPPIMSTKPSDKSSKPPEKPRSTDREPVLPPAKRPKSIEPVLPATAKPKTSVNVMSKDLVHSKDIQKVPVQPRQNFPVRKPEKPKPKPGTAPPVFSHPPTARLIIQLGEDSDSSDDLEGTEEPEDLSLQREEPWRQTNMYHMKDYCSRTGVGDAETSKPPEESASSADFSKQIDKFLKDVRSSHEASAAQEPPIVTQVTVLKPIHVTPLAVRHLPASKQEEYRKLKQMIAERELQKKTQKRPNAMQAQSKAPPPRKATSNEATQPAVVNEPSKVQPVPVPSTSPKISTPTKPSTTSKTSSSLTPPTTSISPKTPTSIVPESTLNPPAPFPLNRLEGAGSSLATTKKVIPFSEKTTLNRANNPDFFRGAPIRYAHSAPPTVVAPSSAPKIPAAVGQPVGDQVGPQTKTANPLPPGPQAKPSNVPTPSTSTPSTSVNQQYQEKQLEEAEMNLLKERSSVVGQIMGLTRLQDETENAMRAQDVCESNLVRILDEFDKACKEWLQSSIEVKTKAQCVKEKRDQLRGSYIRTEGLAKSCKSLGAQVRGAAYTLPVGNMMQSKQKAANQQFGRMVKWRKDEQKRMRSIIDRTDMAYAFLKSRCQQPPTVRLNPNLISNIIPTIVPTPAPILAPAPVFTPAAVPVPPPLLPSRMTVVTPQHTPPGSDSQKGCAPRPLPVPETPKLPVSQGQENSPSASCARRLLRVAKRRLRDGGKPREIAKQQKAILGENNKPAVEKKQLFLTNYKSPLDHLGNDSSDEVFFDPEAILCPYELNGKCEDDECLYQHQAKDTNRELMTS